MDEQASQSIQQIQTELNLLKYLPTPERIRWLKEKIQPLRNGTVYWSNPTGVTTLIETFLASCWQLLEDEHPDVQAAAANTVLDLCYRRELVQREDVWLKHFQRATPDLKLQAALILAKIGSAKGIAIIFPYLLSLQDRAVRKKMKGLMFRANSLVASHHWMELKNSDQPYLRRQAKRSLFCHPYVSKDQPCEICGSTDFWFKILKEAAPGDLRSHAAELLAKHRNEESMDPLFEAFRQAHRRHARQLRKAMSHWLDARCTRRWGELLLDPRPYIRWNAAKALRHMPFDPDVRQTLLNALQDPDLKNRLAVLDTLCLWQESSPYFINWLWHRLFTPVHQTGIAVLSAVARRQLVQFAPFVQNLLWHPDPLRRKAAMKCLATLGYQGAFEPLMTIAADANEEVSLRQFALCQAKRLTGPSNASLVKALAQNIPELNKTKKTIENNVNEWHHRILHFFHRREKPGTSLLHRPLNADSPIHFWKLIQEAEQDYLSNPKRFLVQFPAMAFLSLSEESSSE